MSTPTSNQKDPNATSISLYVKELCKISFATWDHSERISGILGIFFSASLAIFTLLGISVTFTPTFAQILTLGPALWILFLVLIVAPYRVWHRISLSNYELNGKLSPQLVPAFDPDIPGCISLSKTTDGQPVKFFRLKVETSGKRRLSGCEGHLVSVKKNGLPTQYADSLQLSWAPAEAIDNGRKDINDKVPEYLDIGAIGVNGIFWLATSDRKIPNSIVDLFSERAHYQLGLVITCDESPSASFDVELQLRSGIENTQMKCL